MVYRICSLCHQEINMKRLLECDVDPFGNFIHSLCVKEICQYSSGPMGTLSLWEGDAPYNGRALR